MWLVNYRCAAVFGCSALSRWNQRELSHWEIGSQMAPMSTLPERAQSSLKSGLLRAQRAAHAAKRSFNPPPLGGVFH